MCRLFASLLFVSGQASVINVASVYQLLASRAPMMGYHASKGALVNASSHLASQWATGQVVAVDGGWTAC